MQATHASGQETDRRRCGRAYALSSYICSRYDSDADAADATETAASRECGEILMFMPSARPATVTSMMRGNMRRRAHARASYAARARKRKRVMP